MKVMPFVVASLPIATLGLFAWSVRVECCKYLGADGRYILGPMSVLPEDVLGFGPWPIWAIIFVALLISCVSAYRWATHSRWYFGFIGLAFVALAATDWHYYRGLEQAVLGR
jgi:hypothetical protein